MSSKPTPSTPIPITRLRSASQSSADSGGVPGLSPSSTSSQSPPQSPLTTNKPTASSPILSYFLSKDGIPKSPSALRTNLPPTFEKDGSAVSPNNNNAPLVSPVLGHHRSLSLSSPWSRFPMTGPASNTPTAKNSQERTTGIFRRLSLSGGAGAFQRPTIPNNEPMANEDTGNALYRAQTIGTSTAGNTLPRTRPHGRRATLSPGDVPKPRAPSPMGERMLKGHFDGFV